MYTVHDRLSFTQKINDILIHIGTYSHYEEDRKAIVRRSHFYEYAD